MRALKKFGRLFGVKDWFNWYLFVMYLFFGIVGGIVWSDLAREIRG